MVTKPLGKLVPIKFLEFVTLVTVRSNSLEAVILDLLGQDGEMSLAKLFEVINSIMIGEIKGDNCPNLDRC